MERFFIYDVPAVLAVPPQLIFALGRSWLLQYDTYSVCETDRVVRCIWRKEKHLPFANRDVPEDTVINDLKQHGAAILIEPFSGFVDMIVRPGVRAAHNLDFGYEHD